MLNEPQGTPAQLSDDLVGHEYSLILRGFSEGVASVAVEAAGPEETS